MAKKATWLAFSRYPSSSVHKFYTFFLRCVSNLYKGTEFPLRYDKKFGFRHTHDTFSGMRTRIYKNPSYDVKNFSLPRATITKKREREIEKKKRKILIVRNNKISVKKKKKKKIRDRYSSTFLTAKRNGIYFQDFYDNSDKTTDLAERP